MLHDTDGTTTIKSSDEPTIFGEIIFTTTRDRENSIIAASTAVLEGTSSRLQHFICGEGTLSFTFIWLVYMHTHQPTNANINIVSQT